MSLIVVSAATVCAAAARHIAEVAEMNRLIARTKLLCAEAVPSVQRASFTPTAVVLRRPGHPDRRGWSIQIADENEEYLGDTVWDAERAELVAASWRLDREERDEGNGLSSKEAVALARIRLSQMTLPYAGTDWRLLREPEVRGNTHVVWCEAKATRLRVQLDAAGRLLTVEQLPSPTAVPGLAGHGRWSKQEFPGSVYH